MTEAGLLDASADLVEGLVGEADDMDAVHHPAGIRQLVTG